MVKYKRWLNRVKAQMGENPHRPLKIDDSLHNFKLLEKGYEIIWQDLGHQMHHYILNQYMEGSGGANDETAHKLEVLFKSNLKGVNLYQLPANLPPEIVDKIRSTGATFHLEIPDVTEEDGITPKRNSSLSNHFWKDPIRNCANIIDNLEGIPTFKAGTHRFLREFMKLTGRPYELKVPFLTDRLELEFDELFEIEGKSELMDWCIAKDSDFLFVVIEMEWLGSPKEKNREVVGPLTIELLAHPGVDETWKIEYITHLLEHNDLLDLHYARVAEILSRVLTMIPEDSALAELIKGLPEPSDNTLAELFTKLLMLGCDRRCLQNYKDSINALDKLSNCIRPEYEKYYSVIPTRNENLLSYLAWKGIPLPPSLGKWHQSFTRLSKVSRAELEDHVETLVKIDWDRLGDYNSASINLSILLMSLMRTKLIDISLLSSYPLRVIQDLVNYRPSTPVKNARNVA